MKSVNISVNIYVSISVNILSEDAKILEFNQYQKSDKAPFIIYADLEKQLMDAKLILKINLHIPSGFSMSTISSCRSIENKHVYRGKDCMKKLCEFLREHAMKIINFKKKKTKLLTKKQQESYQQECKNLLYL